MGLLRRNPAFPDTLPIGSGYEGLQRREMQQREVDVTRKLVGYVPTIFTDANGNRWEVHARPIGTGTPWRKWGLVPQSGSPPEFTLAVGKVRDGSANVAITNDSVSIVPSANDAVWLERDGAVPTGIWTLEIKTGAFEDIWEFDDATGTTMTKYRKKLMTFTGDEPYPGAPQIGDGLWVDYHTAAGDLAAITTVVKNPDNNKSVAVIEIVPD